MSADKQTEAEMLKEIERLQKIEEQQRDILDKHPGEKPADRLRTDGKGKVIIDKDDKELRKLWDVE